MERGPREKKKTKTLHCEPEEGKENVHDGGTRGGLNMGKGGRLKPMLLGGLSLSWYVG